MHARGRDQRGRNVLAGWCVRAHTRRNKRFAHTKGRERARRLCLTQSARACAAHTPRAGDLRAHPRRDLRAGTSRGSAALLLLPPPPADASSHAHAHPHASAPASALPAAVVRVTTEWDEPFGGAPTCTQRSRAAHCAELTTHTFAMHLLSPRVGAGIATETFALHDGEGGRTLVVDTAMRFKTRPGSVAYRTVYRRG